MAEWENNLETSAGQFNYAMKHFAQTNKKNLILDLRNNGGGFLSILTSIVSHFISDNNTSTPIISYAENKEGNKMAEYFSQPTKKSKYNFENIIVLVNSGSASASEALVGAMLDYDRENVLKVVVEGNNGVYSSYGKGIMQDTIVAKNNRQALKLTTAKIFWPLSGISIHKIGINKSISLYSNKIYESKNQTTSVDPLIFAIGLLNN